MGGKREGVSGKGIILGNWMGSVGLCAILIIEFLENVI